MDIFVKQENIPSIQQGTRAVRTKVGGKVLQLEEAFPLNYSIKSKIRGIQRKYINAGMSYPQGKKS